MTNRANSEAALIHALLEAEVPPLEAVVDLSESEKLREYLHISGAAFHEPDGSSSRDDAVRYAIKLVFGTACWDILLGCIDDPAEVPALVLLVDAPQPDASLRKQLMKDANRGVRLPCIVFGFTERAGLGWTGRFVSHLSSRGYDASLLYLGGEADFEVPATDPTS